MTDEASRAAARQRAHELLSGMGGVCRNGCCIGCDRITTELLSLRTANADARAALRFDCAHCQKSTHWRDGSRCVECRAMFCDPCIKLHFAESGDDFKLGGERAKRHFETVDGWIKENDALKAANAALEAERDAARKSICGNTPCPVCGDGPLGDWSEGDEVRCDGCGTALYVSCISPCLGSTSFELGEMPCFDCKGEGFIGTDPDAPAPDCEKCAGTGYRVPTLDEAKLKGEAP